MPRYLQHLQSGVFWKFPAAGLGPSGGRELEDLLIGCSGQTDEDVSQVGLGVDALPPATFDQCVDDRAELPGVGVADEQSVHLAQRKKREVFCLPWDGIEKMVDGGPPKWFQKRHILR